MRTALMLDPSKPPPRYSWLPHHRRRSRARVETAWIGWPPSAATFDGPSTRVSELDDSERAASLRTREQPFRPRRAGADDRVRAGGDASASVVITDDRRA